MLFSDIPNYIRLGGALGTLASATVLTIVVLRRNPDAAARRSVAMGLLAVGSASIWSMFGGQQVNLQILGEEISFSVAAADLDDWMILPILVFSLGCFAIAARLLTHSNSVKLTESDGIFGQDWPRTVQHLMSSDFETMHADLHVRLSDELGANTKELSRLYVEPDGQITNPADYNEDNPVSTIRFPVSEYLEQFLKKQFIEKDGSHILFVLSDAGMGKSSLFAMLALSAINFKRWPKGVKVEFFKIGPGVIESLSKIEKKQDTILLLDSLDEDQSIDDDVEERIGEILRATLPFRQVLISVRTQFLPTEADFGEGPGVLRIGGFGCSVLYLAPFSDKQVSEYLSNFYRNTLLDFLNERITGRPNDRILAAQKICERIQSLQMRPMLLQHIDRLSSEYREKENLHEYDLYNDLVHNWLHREERKQGGPKSGALLNACIELAVQLQKNGSRKISSSDIVEFFGANSDLNKQLSLVDIEARSLVNKTSRNEWRFSHYSIQEFLVVFWFCNLAEHTRHKIQFDSSAHRSISATDLMVTFIERFSSRFREDASGLCVFDFSNTRLSSIQKVLEDPIGNFISSRANYVAIYSLDLRYTIVHTNKSEFKRDRCLVPINWGVEGEDTKPKSYLWSRTSPNVANSEHSFRSSLQKVEIIAKTVIVSLFLRKSDKRFSLRRGFERADSDRLDDYLRQMAYTADTDDIYFQSISLLKSMGIHSYTRSAEEALGVGSGISESRRKFSLLADTLMKSGSDCGWSYSLGIDLDQIFTASPSSFSPPEKVNQ